jgi:hypothetical protein
MIRILLDDCTAGIGSAVAGTAAHRPTASAKADIVL